MVAVVVSTLTTIAADFDVIIKTNSEKIEALIQEVSDVELRFKKANNPNGPTFVLKLDEVASILYANGEVQAITHKSPSAGNFVAEPSQPIPGGRLQHISDNTYSINGESLSGKELEYFLQRNCPQAFNYYKVQKSTENAGWSFLVLGPVLCLPVGLTLYACSVSVSGRYYSVDEDMLISGAFFMGLGSAMTVASIPMIACGHVNKQKVDEVYNMHCARRSAFNPELKLTAGANGLGLALAF